MPAPLLSATVSEIGEYIRYRSCQRRFKLGFNQREEAKRLPFAERLFNTIDPVLKDAGRKREEEWEQSLQRAGFGDVCPAGARAPDEHATWSDFINGIAALPTGQSAFAREVEVNGEFSSFAIHGRIDFCLLLWRDGIPIIRLVEGKASRRDRTYHRIQVALYGLIVRQLLGDHPTQVDGSPITPRQVECVVARIDESTNQSQAILELAPLDLSQEETDVRRLLAEDGSLRRIVESPLNALDYQLDPKCDDCVFGVHCFPESARLRRLQLLGLEPSIVRGLESVGVETIDHLADLDLEGAQARAARALPGFNQSLAGLQRLAHARRSTLPNGTSDPDTYEVEALPNFPQSQLPEHVSNGRRLVRVYLTVHYDYVENRIGALSAHVTASSGMIETPWMDRDGRPVPDPRPKERVQTGVDADGNLTYGHQDVRGVDINHRYKSSPWTGRYDEDTGTEREIIQGFFDDLVNAIAEVAQSEEAPVHFYVWTRSEMAHLVEACSRVGSGLLGHLRELLGCREPLEQLIYSCLEDEVRNRYALGWTGRGLVVATSLRWFGRRYLWKRLVAGAEIDLDQKFTQDIFDFKTELWLDAANEWTEKEASGSTGHKFEVRSRFHDTLTAPYWRALWGQLQDPATLPPRAAKLANSIRRYQEGGDRNRFRAYLSARAHALRWIEESIRFKNPEISKPLLRIADLVRFTLGIDNPAGAAVDFLRLDHHVALTDWIAARLVPPAFRVGSGRTIPIVDVQCVRSGVLQGRIDLTGYGITLDALQEHCAIGEGSWVRITPCDVDPQRGQTVGQLLRAGSTCEIVRLDWDTGEVELSVRPPINGDRYRLPSFSHRTPGQAYPYATLDESPSNYVNGRVDARLRTVTRHHAYEWLNPIDPQVAPQEAIGPARAAQLAAVLDQLVLPNGKRLADDQKDAALEGLATRIQLLQGPPGTGKTTTTAESVLLRILARCGPGDVVLIGANTHAAVNTLLDQIVRTLGPFEAACGSVGMALPTIRVARVDGRPESPPKEPMEEIRAESCVRRVQALSTGGILIAGGTTNGLLKMARELDRSATFGARPAAFQAHMLVIDEASMMVFPYFLALATMVACSGEIMLAGDHRQLAPILAHDWEREDRPPVVLYQPYASAYDAVRSIAQRPSVPPTAVRDSKLRYTFRLPPAIRELVSRLYRLDDIVLDGLPAGAATAREGDMSVWETLWHPDGGLYLVVHSETRSTSSNPLEAAVLERILAGSTGGLGPDTTAIVTPHRAQRNLLAQRLEAFAGPGQPVGVIDTVERLQGDQRPHILVSASQSDPASIAARADFILNANRSNVAFSRAQERLIVVCARSLLDHIPSDYEHYQSTMLWKSLRELCSELVGTAEVDGHTVQVFTPPLTRTGVAAVDGFVGPAIERS